MFERLVQALDEPDALPQQRLTLAVTLGLLGWLYVRVGRFEQARHAFEENQNVLQTLDPMLPPGPVTDPLIGLSMVASIQGDYETALTLGEQARQRNQHQNNDGNVMMACYVLVGPVRANGQYEDARYYAQQAYDLASEQDNYWFMALILNDLGSVARLQGDYPAAQKYHQASFDISLERFNDRGGMAGSLNHLAAIAELQQQYIQAKALYQQSVDIYREVGDRAGHAQALMGLGKIACVQQKYSRALHYLLMALQHAYVVGLTPMILTVLLALAELSLRRRDFSLGVRLLSFVRQHPAADYETRQLVDDLRKDFQRHINAKTFALAWSKGPEVDMVTLVSQLEAELRLDAKRPAHEIANDALPQPLTKREFEVLLLLADGLRDREIAEALYITVGTVRNPHMINIRQKLEARNRAEALIKARELGLIP